MRTLRWIVLAGIVFISCQVQAQAKIGITIDSFPTHISTLDSGSQANLTMHVHNYGNALFQDTVSLQYVVNNTLYNANSPGQGLYFVADTFRISPNDSATANLTLIYNLPTLETIGTSAVVIWPISNGAATYDSLFYTVQVTFPAGENPVTGENLQVFIRQQQLFINTTAQNLLSRVRIYDIQGQMLLERSLSSSAPTPMDNYPSGCYLVEVVLTDGSQQVYKLININNR